MSDSTHDARQPLDLHAAALASEDFVKFAEGKAPKKVVVVPGTSTDVLAKAQAFILA